MIDPPTVLLERSFVAALVDASDPAHDVAGRCYLALIDEFAAGTRLLAVTSDTRAEFADAAAALLAPCDTLHVAGQERHAAARLRFDSQPSCSSHLRARPSLRSGARPALPVPIDSDLALNLVLVHRRKLAAVATFDRRYDAFDVPLVPGFSN